MKITKDYVFSVIERLGKAVAKKGAEVAPPATQPRPTTSTGRPILSDAQVSQREIANALWHIQKKVAYGDIRPTAAMTELNVLCERNKLLVEEDWRNLLRSIAV